MNLQEFLSSTCSHAPLGGFISIVGADPHFKHLLKKAGPYVKIDSTGRFVVDRDLLGPKSSVNSAEKVKFVRAFSELVDYSTTIITGWNFIQAKMDDRAKTPSLKNIEASSLPLPVLCNEEEDFI